MKSNEIGIVVPFGKYNVVIRECDVKQIFEQYAELWLAIDEDGEVYAFDTEPSVVEGDEEPSIWDAPGLAFDVASHSMEWDTPTEWTSMITKVTRESVKELTHVILPTI